MEGCQLAGLNQWLRNLSRYSTSVAALSKDRLRIAGDLEAGRPPQGFPGGYPDRVPDSGKTWLLK